jgi:hypothetical protein
MVDVNRKTRHKTRRLRLTIGRMMVAVAIIALILLAAKFVFIDNQPRDFLFVALSILDGKHSTVYAEGFREWKFRAIRAGMSMREVEEIMGPPLEKGRWIVGAPGQPASTNGPEDDYWGYTAAGKVRGNYWQRQVFFRNGVVHSTEARYYLD